MAFKVVHFDMNGADGETLATFYAELFGWKVEPVPQLPYWTVDTRGGDGINGGIGHTPDAGTWGTFYVQTDDPQALLDRALELGGTLMIPVMEMGVVTVAMFADLDGLPVGIVKTAPAGPGAGGPSEGDGTPVDWFEVLGSEAERTQRFYGELFGWELTGASFPGYATTTAQDTGIGGGVGAGDGETWTTVYARVADVEASLAHAEELGGKRVYGPNEPSATMTAGAFRDPAGNVFGVYATS